MKPFESHLFVLADDLQPHWAKDTILGFPEDHFRRRMGFVSKHHWQAEGSINVYRVVGTRHADYIGMTWRELLANGKRMRINHSLWEQNPDYYEGVQIKAPLMSFITLDGMNWYVDGDGNHRTCIARFHFGKDHRSGWLHGVGLSDYRLDDSFANAFTNLDALVRDRLLNLGLKHRSKMVRREDGPTWKLDHFSNWATIEPDGISGLPPDLETNPGTKELGTDDLLRLYRTLSMPAWRRWFAAG